jgi:transcriptional regulator with XRE-family HTH domain
MSVRERFIELLEMHEMQQTTFAEKSGYGLSALKMFLNGRTKFPRLDFCLAIKNVFPYLSLDWLIIGEGPKWVSPPPPGVDPEWDAAGGTVAQKVEAQILADSSPQEVAQAESLVTKLLLREIKRMRDDMKDSNPGLVDKYGLDELLEDVE